MRAPSKEQTWLAGKKVCVCVCVLNVCVRFECVCGCVCFCVCVVYVHVRTYVGGGTTQELPNAKESSVNAGVISSISHIPLMHRSHPPKQ